MLIFEITKTNTPLPQKGLAPILIAPPHTYCTYANQAMISSVKQSKINVTHLEKKQSKLGVRSQTFPLLEFSPALESWSNIYMGPTSCLIVTPCLHRTRAMQHDNCRVQCKHGVSHILSLGRFPLLFIICHLYLSVVAWLMSVMCTEHSLLCIMSRHAPYCWSATSLFW